MKPTLTLTLITALLSVYAMDKAPRGKHDPRDILEICNRYRPNPLHAWSECQLRMCIKAATESNEPAILDDLLQNHLNTLFHDFRIRQVTSIMPNLIVACSVDDKVDVLRVLVKHHEMSLDTLKAAFIRAAASGAYWAVDVLVDRPEGIISLIGTEAIIEAYHAGQFDMCRRLLTMLKVEHNPGNHHIINIKAHVLDEHAVVAKPIKGEPAADKGEVKLEPNPTKTETGSHPKDEFEGWDVSIVATGPEPAQPGWTWWGALSSFTRMVTEAAVRLYNGIPAIITYDKQDVEEFFEEANK